MGLVKNCQLCNKQFTTRSIKSAVWEKHCYECHTHTKRATHISRTQRKQNNLEASLRDELKTLTKKVTDIDVLISAEVSNAMMNMTNNDIFERITASVNARLNRLENEIQEKWIEQSMKIERENEKFREKIQNQILVLNNKIVKIMKDME